MPTGASFQRPPQSQPQPAPADGPPTKRDLTSWWKQFKKNTRRDEEREQDAATPGIFGVPLSTSIRYANVAISLTDANGQSFTYGYVPIVVAKCGVYLKEKATHVEGIFRLAGAERRIKELQVIFNSPDRYGKGLDWTGYTVHDAANILRRYLRDLPEPIIPLQFYDKFRDPMKNHQAPPAGESEAPGDVTGEFDPEATIRTYQQLITELPPLNRQLLLYILDLLAVFASKSDVNLMDAPNLSRIFQPALLSNPSHNLAPAEYTLSQAVLIFLIENQDNFLVGMKGTAADEQTIQDVQSGPHSPARSPGTPTTPKGRTQHLVGRSASSASAGSESVRRYGGVRRNVSVNSKNSRQSNNAPSPVEVPPASPLTPTGKSGGVHRSNTVPSKKSNSPALATTDRFQAAASPESPGLAVAGTPGVRSPLTSNQATPNLTEEIDKAPETLDTPSSVVEPSPRRSPGLLPFMGRKARSPTPNAERDGSRGGNLAGDVSPMGPESPVGTPSRERSGFSSFFRSSPSADRERSEGRRPNKLQKRRPQEEPASGSISQASLSGGSHPPSPGFAPFPGLGPSSQANLEGQGGELAVRAPMEALATEPSFAAEPTSAAVEGSSTPVPALEEASAHVEQDPSATMVKPEESTALRDLPQRVSEAATLRARQSPSGSVGSRSTANEAAAAENDPGDTNSATKEKHHRWKLSMSSKKLEPPKSGNGSANASATGLGIPLGAAGSTSSVGSLGVPRKSFTDESGSGAQVYSSSDAEDRAAGERSTEKRGFSGWFKGKLQERKDREAEKERAKSPPPPDRPEQSTFDQTLTPAANTDPSPETIQPQSQPEVDPPVDAPTEAVSSPSPEETEQVTGQPVAHTTWG